MILYGTENNLLIDSEDPSHIIDKFYVQKNNNRLSIRIPLTAIENKSNFALSYIDYYGNESKEIITQLPQSVLKTN